MNAGIQPNAFGDWAKYEGKRSKLEDWKQAYLKSWECGRNANEIINVMKSIAHEFTKAHRSLCDKLDVEENPLWVKNYWHGYIVINKLKEISSIFVLFSV